MTTLQQLTDGNETTLTFYYIRDLLEKLPTWDPDRLDELLPDRWKPDTPVSE